MKKVSCIMLVDDNPDDNFFHERVIRKNDAADVVISKESGTEALEYLTTKKESKEAHPDVIFLDINMPGMNGWEFLDEYNKLDPEFRSKVVVVMLTTSDNIEDRERAERGYSISDFRTKPLTKEFLEEILDEYF